MDPLARRQMIAHVQVERQRLLPEHEQATRTTVEMLRAGTGHASEPRLVPYLNLAYLLGVKGTYGDDQLMALALSVANWATTAINDLAHHRPHPATDHRPVRDRHHRRPGRPHLTGSLPGVRPDTTPIGTGPGSGPR
ncbi:hypothetical protein [Streptomyces sp. NPDC056512]|uniref:hypothetical protein n=1 Tax=Streptomyces sp. NPDC056512 TaxID=3345846 RepID=UPI0036D0240D